MEANESTPETVHIMIDIETLDTAPSAVILSIGACVIPPPGDMQLKKMFYEEIEPKQPGRTIDTGTISWWMQQEREGNPCPMKGTTTLAIALISLGEWIRGITDDPIVWAKGSDFDFVIIKDACFQNDVTVPWKYNAVRDMRTIVKLFPASEEILFMGIKHQALNDACNQALQLRRIADFHNFKLA